MNPFQPHPEKKTQNGENTSFTGVSHPIETQTQCELIRLKSEALQYRETFEPVVNAYVEASEAYYRSEKMLKELSQNLDWRSRELTSTESDLRFHLAEVRRGFTRLRRQLVDLIPKSDIIETLREAHERIGQKDTYLIHRYEQLRTVATALPNVFNSLFDLNNGNSPAEIELRRTTANITNTLNTTGVACYNAVQVQREVDTSSIELQRVKVEELGARKTVLLTRSYVEALHPTYLAARDAYLDSVRVVEAEVLSLRSAQKLKNLESIAALVGLRRRIQMGIPDASPEKPYATSFDRMLLARIDKLVKAIELGLNIAELPATSIHIRWMVKSDMPDVLEIEGECVPRPWVADEFVAQLRERDCIGMVAEVNDVAVGFMVYQLHRDRIDLLKFGVGAEFRRFGVGSTLVGKLISQLSPRGRCRLQVEVRGIGSDAQRFFSSQMFKAIGVVGDNPNSGMEDHILMEYRVKRSNELDIRQFNWPDIH